MDGKTPTRFESRACILQRVNEGLNEVRAMSQLAEKESAALQARLRRLDADIAELKAWAATLKP